jgi:hypothetical protein
MLPERPKGLNEVVHVFGDPRPLVNSKSEWERESLTTVLLKHPLVYAYDTNQRIQRVRAHTLLAQHLADTLDKCIEAGVSADRLKYGGCYAWRAKRTSAQLSLHTWGIAVDLEPGENPLGEVWKDDGKRLLPQIIATFKAEGWFWGGDFQGTKDPQHFQWATGI